MLNEMLIISHQFSPRWVIKNVYGNWQLFNLIDLSDCNNRNGHQITVRETKIAIETDLVLLIINNYLLVVSI